MRVRAWTVLLASAAVSVAACGGDDGGQSESEATAASSSSPTTAPVTTPVPVASTTTEAPDESTSTSTTEAPAGPHVVEHAMGSTEVPANPQRVVVLDSSFLDAAVALDAVPLAATEYPAGAGLPAYLGDAVAGVEIVGEITAPNLEAIAALRPDLIIGAKVRHEALYEQLSAIAPTVFSESSGTNWKDQVRLTGDALGRLDRAEELLAEFDASAAEVGEAIGAAGKTASIVRFIPGQIRLYGPSTFSGSVLTAVGFDLGDKAYDPNYGMSVISVEQFDLIGADVIFATNPEAESGGSVESDRGAVAALWESLPAVQNGMQFDIADDTWMTGIGVVGAHKILDDLESWLTL